jgi:hypothetical protein
LSEEGNRLDRALRRILRQARQARRVRLGGRVLLAASLLLLAAFVARVLIRVEYEVEIFPVAPFLVVLLAAAAVFAALGVLEIVLRKTGPGAADVAEQVDDSRSLRNLVAAGLTAADLTGDIPREVTRRAALAAEEISPIDLYPVRRSLAKLAAIVPLLLVVCYLLALPPGRGPLPLLVAGAGLGGSKTDRADAESPPEEKSKKDAEAEEEPEPDPESDPEPEDAPDEVKVRIIAAQERYRKKDPVLLFVLADPGEDMKAPHEFTVSLALDGEVAGTGMTIRVEPGKTGEAVATIDARDIEAFSEKLTPGKHRVAAILTGDGIVAVTEEIEIEIEQDEGGSQDQPEPEPQPSGAGMPPPPPMAAKDRMVDPLFNEGETIKKTGVALVPDPKAPAGSPPRRIGIAEAAEFAGNAGSTAVPTEKVRPVDRPLVSRYFELLRDAK